MIVGVMIRFVRVMMIVGYPVMVVMIVITCLPDTG